MARLNIETSINRDHAFQELLCKVGDRHRAKGICWELWELAQKYWVPERKLIPESEFKKLGLEVTLEVGLAEKRAGGVYARGTEEQCKGLFRYHTGGEHRAESAQRDEHGRFKPKGSSVAGESTSLAGEATVNDQQQPGSLLSSLGSKKNTNTGDVCFLGDELEEAFETFWKAWPNKVDHTEAKKAFKKKKPPIANLLTAIEKYKLKKPEWQNYCHGATFINSKYKSVLRDDYGMNEQQQDAEERRRRRSV